MAGIDRRKDRRVTTTNLAGSTEGVLQGEEIIVCDPVTGEIVGSVVGPVIIGNPDGTTPANTIPMFPAFTEALKAKLESVEADADVNPPLLTVEELAALDGTDARLFTPAQIDAAIAARATGDVLSVNGEIGNVVINSGNLPETDGKVLMLEEERVKLDGIGAGAQPLSIPGVVSGLDGYLGASNWRVSAAPAYTAPVTMKFIGAAVSWTNKPVTGTPGEFAGVPTRYCVDARTAVDIQLFGSVNTAADGTHRLLLRYNITANAVGEGGTWVVIPDSDISIATTGDKFSAVAAFPGAAKIDKLWIQLAGDAATGTTQSPKFTQVQATMNVAVNTAQAVASTPGTRLISILTQQSTYTGAPVGETEWRSGGGLNETTRWFHDFSRASQYQIKVNIGGASATGAILKFGYSTNAGSTWTPLPGATLDAYTSGTFDKIVGGGWLTPPAGVGPCLIRMTLENTTAGTISPTLRGLYMACDETEPTPFTIPAVDTFDKPVAFWHSAAVSWVIPTGTSELGGTAIRVPVDLRRISEVCLFVVTHAGAPAAGTVTRVEWSSTNGSDYAAITGTETAVDGALGQKVGAWAAVPAAAKLQELTWLRVASVATTSATASFRMVIALLKQETTAVLPNTGGGEITTYAEIGESQTGTITAPDADVVLCFNTAAISVNLLPLPRKTQIFWCFGGAISFFGGTGQTINGGGFTGLAGSASVPQVYTFARRASPNQTVWMRGR